MIQKSHNQTTKICNICNGSQFDFLAKRIDDSEILVCKRCGMGVLALVPKDTKFFYDNSYYKNSNSESSSGYVDYDLNSEHGVLWAAELVMLASTGGRVLDIGCADGFLLNSLSSAYEKYGIEVNEDAAKFSESRGIKILGDDILDISLTNQYANYFDVITAIAVFEHITDFKGAIKASLEMLKPNGILLFEVPLMSENNNNATWLNSSLEHVFYPTIKGIRYLFDTELAVSMAGSELIILDYASTYIGIVTKDEVTALACKTLLDRLLSSPPSELLPQERRAQLLLKVVHAAQVLPESLSYINELFGSSMQAPFISRCLDLWKTDLIRLKSITDYLAEVEVAKNWHVENAERWKLEALRTEKNLAEVEAAKNWYAENAERLRLEVLLLKKKND
jgi:O-antigen biosynthesis protein